jgi:arylformamidase
MPELIDISVRLAPGMPIWPDSVGIHVERTRSFAARDEVNVSRLDMDVHCGTHVESSLHFIDGASALEAIPLDTFVGPAFVAHLPDADVIDSTQLDRAGIPVGVERLLLRTRNSHLWAAGERSFRTDYAALSADGADWVVRRKIRLIASDYLSVQRFGDDPETHRILMRAEVAILEGVNLADVEEGEYRLICLPIWLGDAEAAPARAVLEAVR